MSRRWQTALSRRGGDPVGGVRWHRPGFLRGPLQQPATPRRWRAATAEFVADRLPAASSTVMFDPTPGTGGQHGHSGARRRARRRGFAVAGSGQPVPAGAHQLRYLVTPMDDGTLVRLTIDESTEERGSSSVTAPVACSPAAPPP